MKPEEIDPSLPNALRWLLIQNTTSFCPWHLLTRNEEFDHAANAFRNEDINQRKVFAFASRQDNDDYAGLEIIDGLITDKVIVFHPVFSASKRNNNDWDIVEAEYQDVFQFLSEHIVSDMRDWAFVEDASEIIG